MKDLQHKFMRAAIRLANRSMRNSTGGPFGCVVVKNGKIIARGNNSVTRHHDPTAHAEVVAIRKACRKLKSFQLDGCELYCSCEPCPMCLGAIYWARPARVYYACTRQDAAVVGFDDEFIYREIVLDQSQRRIPFIRMVESDALGVFEEWNLKDDKCSY